MLVYKLLTWQTKEESKEPSRIVLHRTIGKSANIKTIELLSKNNVLASDFTVQLLFCSSIELTNSTLKWEIISSEIDNISHLLLCHDTGVDVGGRMVDAANSLIKHQVIKAMPHASMFSKEGIVIVQHGKQFEVPIDSYQLIVREYHEDNISIFASPSDDDLAVLQLLAGGDISIHHVPGPIIGNESMLNPPQWFLDKHG